ncbi:LuxR C-terminal-related transcriptional regulator [Nonomuraea turcica]
MIAKGLSNTQIVTSLFIGETTVKTYLSSLLRPGLSRGYSCVSAL